jgi:uncharacterized membrane protein YphA (DoxX/SURF4 family)
MNILLWVLQVVTGLLYLSSAVMKIFMFDKISKDVPSFGALPRQAWTSLGVIELVCTAALIIPCLLHQYQVVCVIAAAILAVESLAFIWVHARYRETGTIVVCAVLGLLMGFIAYGRSVVMA